MDAHALAPHAIRPVFAVVLQLVVHDAGFPRATKAVRLSNEPAINIDRNHVAALVNVGQDHVVAVTPEFHHLVVHRAIQVHDGIGPVLVDGCHTGVRPRSDTHHLTEALGPRTVLQTQHGCLAEEAFSLVSFCNVAAEELAGEVAVQVDPVAQLLHHVILPSQRHHGSQLDVGRVTHQHGVPGRRHEGVTQTSGRPTRRDVLPVDRVATRIPARCLGAPEVEVHRQGATLGRLDETQRTGFCDGGLDAEACGHEVLHIAVLMLEQVGEVLVALGERIGLLVRVGLALLAWWYHA